MDGAKENHAHLFHSSACRGKADFDPKRTFAKN
jgi:hypothetical protein